MRYDVWQEDPFTLLARCNLTNRRILIISVIFPYLPLSSPIFLYLPLQNTHHLNRSLWQGDSDHTNCRWPRIEAECASLGRRSGHRVEVRDLLWWFADQ